MKKASTKKATKAIIAEEDMIGQEDDNIPVEIVQNLSIHDIRKGKSCMMKMARGGKLATNAAKFS